MGGGLAMSANLGMMLQGVGLGGADRLSKAQTELAREDVVLWEDFRVWVKKQFGFGGEGGGASGGSNRSNRLQLFMYDGQDPPGPTLRTVSLELSDIDPALAGGGDDDAFSATLHTRWPNAAVSVSLEGGSGGR